MATELKADETGKAVVPILACVLNQLCARNDRIPFDPNNVSKFHALRAPGISVHNYLDRIGKYAACSGECFVLSLIYIDRIIANNSTFVVNSLNIHRLLITSVMLAAKFFDDHYFNNAYYAKVGGVPTNELNALEVEFLFMTNFTLHVPTDVYRQYYTELWNHALHSQCGCQGRTVPPLSLPPVPAPIDHPRVDNTIVSRTIRAKLLKMKQQQPSSSNGSGMDTEDVFNGSNTAVEYDDDDDFESGSGNAPAAPDTDMSGAGGPDTSMSGASTAAAAAASRDMNMEMSNNSTSGNNSRARLMY
jgi:Cyclin